MNNMTKRVLLHFTFAIGAVFIATISAKADKFDRFYGYWSLLGDIWCELPREEWGTEGAQLIISPKEFIMGFAGKCEDVGKSMHEERMRLSATCYHEGGVSKVNAKLWLDQHNILHFKYEDANQDSSNASKYRRCSEQELDEADRKN